MSAILEKLIEDANVKPVHGVTVGMFGFMVSESSEFPMDDTSDIYAVATLVKEKYGNRAYGFRRCYYLHGQKHFVDKGWVFIQGKMRTAKEVMSDNLPDERILRENVHDNGMEAVISFGGQTFEFKIGKDMILNTTKGENKC